MIGRLVGGDHMYFYITGHGDDGVKRRAPKAIMSSDSEFIGDEFWSTIVKNVPLRAALTAIINTCYSGAFFQEANVESNDHGPVVAFTACRLGPSD
ncbi:hypothetical protein OROGR_024462 [Orobanche gracilis]